jgi:hypothetical protein
MNRYIRLIFFVPLVLMTMEAAGQNKQLQFQPGKYLPDCVVDFNVGPAFTKIKGDGYRNDLKSQAGFTIGGDLTYYFKIINKLKIGASAGLGYTHYGSEYNLNIQRQIQTVDADNESVTRAETANNMKETEKAGYFDIPLLAHADYTINSKIAVYAKTGICYSFVLGSNYASSALYTATGYYPRYNVTLFDIDIDGSPYFYPTDKKMSDKNNLTLKNNFIIPLGIGVKYKYDEMISITVGINEMVGMRNISGYDNSIYKPIVSDDRRFSSLIQNNGKTKTSAFCIDFGVSLSLWNK